MFRSRILPAARGNRKTIGTAVQALNGLEPLEPRLLLSGVDVQSMNLRPAAFIENQGQWANSDLFYLWNARGASIAHTTSGPVIQLRKAVVPEINPATAPTTPGALFSSASSPLTSPSTGQTVDQPQITTDPNALPNLELVPGLAIDQPLDLATIPDPFGRDAAPLNFEIHNVSMRFEGANTVRPRGLELAQGYHNFYVGDPSLHRSNVPGFTSVIYENLYEGIDLVMLAGGDNLKYEFHLAPGADPGLIRIAWEGLENLTLNEAAGELQMLTPVGTLTDSGLYVYQPGETGAEPVAARFGLDEAGRVSFQITGEYDAGRGLVIDPVVAWGTYVGVGGEDKIMGVTTAHTTGTFDGAFTLISGQMYSSSWGSGNYETAGTVDANAFAASFSIIGEHLWTTYLGGSNNDSASDLEYGTSTPDEAYGIILVGTTSSTGWIVGGYDTSYNGGISDAFASHLYLNTGYHIWSTFIGGDSEDVGTAVAITGFNAALAGTTSSSGWVSGGFDTIHGGMRDGFLVGVDWVGSHLGSSYFGGQGDEIIADVVRPSFGSGHYYVVGTTREFGIVMDDVSDSWIHGGPDTDIGGYQDGFLAKGSWLGASSTYIGGDDSEIAYSISQGGNENVLIVGTTQSDGWIHNGYDTSYGGNWDGFLYSINDHLNQYMSTYIGGDGYDAIYDVEYVNGGDVVVIGETRSLGWWPTGEAQSHGDPFGIYLATVEHDYGNPMDVKYASIGRIDSSPLPQMTTGHNMDIVVVGSTHFSDWLSYGIDSAYGGDGDGFIVYIKDDPRDLNGDGELDTTDIDRFYYRLRSGLYSVRYDHNLDSQVTQMDLDIFIREILATEYGDTNIDGSVSLGDLTVLAHFFGMLEFGASWGQGDFNGNGAVTLGDLTILAEHFGFERGPAAFAGDDHGSFGPAALWGLQALGLDTQAWEAEPIAEDEHGLAADILAELGEGLRG